VSPVEYAGGKRPLQAYIAVCRQIHCNAYRMVHNWFSAKDQIGDVNSYIVHFTIPIRPNGERCKASCSRALPASATEEFSFKCTHHTYAAPTDISYYMRPLPSARISDAAALHSPTVDCNKSRDSVDLLEKLRLRRKLRPAL